MTQTVPPHAIGHLTTPGYRAGNSLRGNEYAQRHGIRWVDNDWQVSKDRHDLNTHWGRPNAEGYVSKADNRTWSAFTWAQIQQFKTRDGYEVRDMRQAFIDAKKFNQCVEVEAKFLATAADFKRLAAIAHSVFGAVWRKRVWIKMLTDLYGYDAAVATLRHAKGERFTTLLLLRGADAKRRTFPPHIDYVRGAAAAPIPTKESPMKVAPPSPPMIAARHHGGPQVPKAVVMHGTVSHDDAGTARQIAAWWNGPDSPKTSAHYIRDPKETIQCVGDHTIAYHCGHNGNTIGYELCDEQAGPANRWADADSKAIIAGAAKDVARLCAAYGIAPIRPSVADLKAKGPHGIYGHNDSRLAFGGTTHTDPKDFPWDDFLKLVRAEHDRLLGKTPLVRPVVMTRGDDIDAAIASLKKATPSKANAPKVKAALDSLLSIKLKEK